MRSNEELEIHPAWIRGAIRWPGFAVAPLGAFAALNLLLGELFWAAFDVVLLVVTWTALRWFGTKVGVRVKLTGIENGDPEGSP